jgi:imidazolonepropionase-like amidohydrolase
MRVPQHPAGVDAGISPVATRGAPHVTYTALRCDLLIPGRGEPIEQGALVVKDAKIDWVGKYANIPSIYHQLDFTRVPVLLPGLWDCHVHYGGHGTPAFPTIEDHNSFLPGADALAGAITVADLRRTLEAGFTSVRELSGVRESFPAPPRFGHCGYYEC